MKKVVFGILAGFFIFIHHINQATGFGKNLGLKFGVDHCQCLDPNIEFYQLSAIIIYIVLIIFLNLIASYLLVGIFSKKRSLNSREVAFIWYFFGLILLNFLVFIGINIIFMRNSNF